MIMFISPLMVVSVVKNLTMKFIIYFEDVEIALPLVQEDKKINEMLEELKPKFSQLIDNAKLLKFFKLGIRYGE